MTRRTTVVIVLSTVIGLAAARVVYAQLAAPTPSTRIVEAKPPLSL
jgi:hypothetical protein